MKGQLESNILQSLSTYQSGSWRFRSFSNSKRLVSFVCCVVFLPDLKL